VFWDSEGVIHVDFLPHGATINAQCYSNLLWNDVHQVFQKKPGKLSKKINLLDDSACPQISRYHQWAGKSWSTLLTALT
jgi:hypothetical protein